MNGMADIQMQDLLEDITATLQSKEEVEGLMQQSTLPGADVEGLVEIISELDSTLVPIEPRAEFADHLRTQLLVDDLSVMQRLREMPARVHIAAILAVFAGFLLLMSRKLSGSEASQDLAEEPAAASL